MDGMRKRLNYQQGVKKGCEQPAEQSFHVENQQKSSSIKLQQWGTIINYI